MDGRTLVQKVKDYPPNVEKRSGINKTELREGILSIFHSKDSELMKELVKSYFDWSMKSEKLAGRSPDNKLIYDRVLGMFDWVCQMADRYVETLDEDKAFDDVFGKPFLPCGQVRKFYRNTLELTNERVFEIWYSN